MSVYIYVSVSLYVYVCVSVCLSQYVNVLICQYVSVNVLVLGVVCACWSCIECEVPGGGGGLLDAWIE